MMTMPLGFFGARRADSGAAIGGAGMPIKEGESFRKFANPADFRPICQTIPSLAA
jgi:hypothetical protein